MVLYNQNPKGEPLGHITRCIFSLKPSTVSQKLYVDATILCFASYVFKEKNAIAARNMFAGHVLFLN